MDFSRDYDVPVGTLRREDLCHDFVEKFRRLAFQLQLANSVSAMVCFLAWFAKGVLHGVAYV